MMEYLWLYPYGRPAKRRSAIHGQDTAQDDRGMTCKRQIAQLEASLAGEQRDMMHFAKVALPLPMRFIITATWTRGRYG